MKYPHARLLLFAREPVPGQVKTRLIPALGEAGALDLYDQLLRGRLALLENNGLCPGVLWVDGEPGHPGFAAFSGPRHRQRGADLGERMDHAARQALAHAAPVLLIGADCPALDEDYLRCALDQLAEGNEVVLGPADDGGYVLIGLRRSRPALFRDIDWGTERVLEQTLNKLRGEGIDHALLGTLPDIDRPEDLALLPDYGIYPRISRRYLA